MKQQEFVHHYHSPKVGSLELRCSDRGVRSITFIPRPSRAASSPDHPVLRELVKELDLYFSGELKTFSVPLDPPSGTEFQRKVWEELLRIPYGQTRSYAELAAAVGNPRATRAVGSANGKNHIPIVVPCHRVIRADGTLGGYGSGTHIKKALLKLEGTRAADADSPYGEQLGRPVDVLPSPCAEDLTERLRHATRTCRQSQNGMTFSLGRGYCATKIERTP
jgi:methylated-DNA-[protein]-cysteine S-methyltransferase